MSRLVTYYSEEPVKTKGRVEIQQQQMSDAVGLRSADGAVRPALVYVEVVSEAGPFLVPFGDYDEWSLRDRYNEAIRIMNTLGASTIVCETFGEVTVRRNIRARVLGRGGEMAQQRIENSGFDFQHDGAGSAPRDPRPLRWPDEPGFAAAVSSVLDNGARDVQINIRSNRTYALDGSLAGELRKCGLDLGGASQRTGATSLHIRATFPPMKRGWV
ncbi:hypothetical protein [Klenkia sp. PcliD-1-E]|uniref:hypothetical protein n=1 Tax=Klenkia sp. PcliD-1-E TaxID=2954492 RepID=UPI0020985B21|nr:hypothetical protein [Klenkia sp. PcliD-1-E]MCO7218493.1 hypothetical protein [Klenkia sp. PcliD-1-E]